jgi:hypothetical protein
VPSNRTKSASKRKKKTTWKNEKKSLKGKSVDIDATWSWTGRRTPLETFSMHPIRTCQWSWSWIGRAFPSKHIQHNWSTNNNGGKILNREDTFYSVGPWPSLPGLSSLTLVWWHLVMRLNETAEIIISLSNCPIIIVLRLLQNHLHRLLFRDNLLCEETLQLQEISF